MDFTGYRKSPSSSPILIVIFDLSTGGARGGARAVTDRSGASIFTDKKAVTSGSGYLLSNLFEVIVWQAQLVCQD